MNRGLGFRVAGGQPGNGPGQPRSNRVLDSLGREAENPTARPVAEKEAATHASDKHEDAPAVALGTAVELPPVSTNKIGMKLALLPVGEFLMGSPNPNAPPQERPEHKVKISTPFYFGTTEVTQSQYQAITGNNPSFFSPSGEGKDKIVGQPYGDYPVEQVSWFDAVLFCNGLSKRHGLTPYYVVNGETVRVPDPHGRGYRLPTEAEWEYACREGKSGPYSIGPEPLVEYGWFRANSEGSTHPVGKKRPNKFGLYDMAANVWEWCFDEYSAEYYQHSPEVDPMGPVGMSTRVRRGGSGWRSPQRATWWSDRGGVVPIGKDLVTGFRVARTADIAGDAAPKTPAAAVPAPRGLSAVAPAAAGRGQQTVAATPARALRPGSPEELLQTHGLTALGYLLRPRVRGRIPRDFSEPAATRQSNGQGVHGICANPDQRDGPEIRRRFPDGIDQPDRRAQRESRHHAVRGEGQFGARIRPIRPSRNLATI